MHYRKKPVVIEAIQWDGNRISEVTDWMSEAINKPFNEPGAVMRLNNQPTGHEVHIRTLEGVMIASPGDFIIKGIKGEIYPCKPDIFNATYDQVENHIEEV